MILIDNNLTNDVATIKKFERQIKCSYKINIDDEDNTKSYYCNLNSCPICMSKKASDYIRKYSEELEKMQSKYHFVLTIKSPRIEELRKRINQMFKFWSNSGLKKNKT